jgi:hypothetical protein
VQQLQVLRVEIVVAVFAILHEDELGSAAAAEANILDKTGLRTVQRHKCRVAFGLFFLAKASFPDESLLELLVLTVQVVVNLFERRGRRFETLHVLSNNVLEGLDLLLVEFL